MSTERRSEFAHSVETEHDQDHAWVAFMEAHDAAENAFTNLRKAFGKVQREEFDRILEEFGVARNREHEAEKKYRLDCERRFT